MNLDTRTPPPVPNRVTVVDVDMPFVSMIVFMVKWAIAAIPAVIILVVLGALAAAVLDNALTRAPRARPAADGIGGVSSPLDEWHRRCDASIATGAPDTALARQCLHDFEVLAAAQQGGAR